MAKKPAKTPTQPGRVVDHFYPKASLQFQCKRGRSQTFFRFRRTVLGAEDPLEIHFSRFLFLGVKA